ncbi:MAG: lipid asymmetry maintenance protein MlaB [Gammaproteobacteria bacterium]
MVTPVGIKLARMGGSTGQIRQLGSDRYALSGPLTFESVPLLWQEGLQLVARQPCVTLDLSGITRTDSAGLAVMIEWMRAARLQNGSIRFCNIPSQLRAIAGATGVEHLFADDQP